MDIRPINPFIVGGPVPASKFIGRKEQVNIILGQLANPEGRGSSAISGERRIGKTSLLHYIASPEAAREYGLSHSQFAFVSADTQTLGSYMGSQNVDTFSETVFWHYILQFLSTYQIPGTEYAKELLERERVGVLDLIPLLAQVAAQDKLVVLLLDEFEWIINNIDPQNPTLLQALRVLIDRPAREKGVALITSSKESLNVLCSHIKFVGSPMPNALVSVHLRPFSRTEAYELIDKYLEGNAVAFSDEDKDFAYDLSKGHPYLLQRACFDMFNRYREHPGVLSDADRGAIENEIRAEIAAGREERPRTESIHPLGEPAELKKQLAEKESEAEAVRGTWTAAFLVCFLGAGISMGFGLLLDIPFLAQLSICLLLALIPFLLFRVVLKRHGSKDGEKR